MHACVYVCLHVCGPMYVGRCHLSNHLGVKVIILLAGLGDGLGCVVGKSTLVHQTLDSSECHHPQKSVF